MKNGLAAPILPLAATKTALSDGVRPRPSDGKSENYNPYLQSFGLTDTKTYKITGPSDVSALYAICIRNTPYNWSLPADVEQYCIEYFDTIFPTTLHLPVALGDVNFISSGASGYGYTCCRNKHTALYNHWDEVSFYIKNFSSPSAPKPIFTYMHKKGEILPYEKAMTKVRPIIYPPLHFYMLHKTVTQSFDNAIKQSQSNFSYGKSVLGSHFSQVAHTLLSKDYLFKGDCTKFDSSVGPHAFGIINKIRKRFAHPSCHAALDFVYNTLSSKMVAMPDGSIIVDTRQPSGQACTTTDNSLYHRFAITACYAMHFRSLHGRLPLYSEIDKNLSIWLYSDDHIASTNDKLFSTFAVRSHYYSMMGLTLKEEDDQSGGHLSQYTYLGGRFVPLINPNGLWAYLYDDDTLLEQLYVMSPYMSSSDISQALVSYGYLTAADPIKFGRIRTLCEYLNSQPGFGCEIKLPRRNDILSMFVGYESSRLLATHVFNFGLPLNVPHQVGTVEPDEN